MAHDRDQAHTAQRALAHRAMHDELTGLSNRALLFDRGRAAAHQREREPMGRCPTAIAACSGFIRLLRLAR